MSAARPRFARVVVAGLGLLGGSLALALKRRGLAGTVTAWVRDPAAARPAVRAGLVDAVSRGPECARNADLAVLCTPYTCFEPQLRELARIAPPGCLVTDVGSVKGPLGARWHRAAGPLKFVASHPMAGGERSGWRNASASLFEGAACILTPLPRTDPGALRGVRELWRALGAEVSLTTPAEHDRLVARVSHLPHAAAFALARSLARGGRPGDFAWAGRGFLDTTRVAASSPDLWAGIFRHHPDRLDRGLAALEREVHTLRRLIRAGAVAPLRAYLARAARFRLSAGRGRG